MASALHPHAAARLRELREQHGVEPTVDEIIALHEASGRIDRADASDSEVLLDLPVRVGTVLLYAPTVQVLFWWSIRGREWFDGHPQELAVTAYLLAHGREEGLTDRLVTYRDTLRIVEAWWNALGATRDEIDAAVDRLFRLQSGGQSVETSERVQPDFWEFLAALGETLPPEAVLRCYQYPLGWVARLLRKRDLLAHGSGHSAFDPVTIAVHQEQQVFRSILTAHKGAPNGQ